MSRAAGGDGPTAVVADDEPLARRRLAALLRGHPTVRLIGQSATGPATVAMVQELAPDILFLDVQMPGLNGFEVLAALPVANHPVVVFSTAYDEYALAAFEVHAVDYLLKPFSDARFAEALALAERACRSERAAEWHRRVLGLLADVAAGAPAAESLGATPAAAPVERFSVRKRDRVVLIDAARVDWIEAARDYVRLHVGTDLHLVRVPLAALESRLDPRRFVRIHRSTIVQVGQVCELHPDLHGDYIAVLRTGARLRISRRFRDRALARLGVEG